MKATFFGSLKTLLDLIRMRNAAISFLGVYVGALVFLLKPSMPLLEVLKAAVSTSLILGAGNTLNDYFDFEIDRVNRPKRPIPSGRISRRWALIVSVVLFLVGLGFALGINDLCFDIALFNSALLVMYAAYGKRMLLASNIMISYLVASVFLYGAAAVHSPTVSFDPAGAKLVVILALCAFFVNFSREIVKDIEDVEGDMKKNSLTLPIRYGEKNARLLAFTSAVFAVLISLTPVLSQTHSFNRLAYTALLIPTDIMILFSFTTCPATNQKLLVLSMTLALLSFLLGATI
ncbi:MAG: UbiA family prenyltransferase [Candidatus Altiarchaeota archaeon]